MAGNPFLHQPVADRQQRRAEKDADEAEGQRAADYAEEDQDETACSLPWLMSHGLTMLSRLATPTPQMSMKMPQPVAP